MYRRRAFALPALVLAAALTGCSSGASSGDGSPSGHIDPRGSTGAARVGPCSLLSDADITAAGGQDGTHVPDTSDFGAGCNYGLVRLYPKISQGQFDFHPSAQAVAGVGEEAWLDKNLHQLRFRTATHRLVIVCVLCEDDGSKTLPKLATTVIGNLPR